MIKELKLKNFQAHKNSILKLHPGVNVLVGETNSGKSAIIRALYWLAFGKPSGDSIIRHKIATECEVEVVLEEDVVVKRVRGKTANYYQINDETYKGFGQNVPEAVQTALNLSDINFARQMDPPFLLSKSSGDVAQYLNKLVNLDIIGTSLSSISSMVREAEKRKQYHTNKIQEYEDKLNELDWVVAAEKAIDKIEKKTEAVAVLETKKNNTQLLLASYDRAREIYDSVTDHQKFQKRISAIEETLSTLNDFLLKERELRTVIANYTKAYEQKEQLKTFIPLENNIGAIEIKIKSLQTQIEAYKILQKETNTLSAHTKSFEEWLEKEAKYTSMLKQAMPKICPLCEQEIR